MDKEKIIDFSYSDEKTGKDILDFCNEMLTTKRNEINDSVYHMLSIIRMQIKR